MRNLSSPAGVLGPNPTTPKGVPPEGLLRPSRRSFFSFMGLGLVAAAKPSLFLSPLEKKIHRPSEVFIDFKSGEYWVACDINGTSVWLPVYR